LLKVVHECLELAKLLKHGWKVPTIICSTSKSKT